MTRRRLLADLDSRELSEWLAFWGIEHLGGPEERADLRTGILGSLIANITRDEDKTPRPFVATDFMPFYEEPPEAETGSASAMSPESFSRMMHTLYPQAG